MSGRRSKIFVDATRPATLNDGAGKQTDFASLEEAVRAWRLLPSVVKIRATVKLIGGPVLQGAADRSASLPADAGRRRMTGPCRSSYRHPARPRMKSSPVLRPYRPARARPDIDETYVVFDGRRIAKRGNPGTLQAGTWVS